MFRRNKEHFVFIKENNLNAMMVYRNASGIKDLRWIKTPDYIQVVIKTTNKKFEEMIDEIHRYVGVMVNSIPT